MKDTVSPLVSPLQASTGMLQGLVSVRPHVPLIRFRAAVGSLPAGAAHLEAPGPLVAAQPALAAAVQVIWG